MGHAAFISQYAVVALAMTGGALLIKRFADTIAQGPQPAVNMLEVFFFAKLCNGGLTLYAQDSQPQWRATSVVPVARLSDIPSLRDTRMYPVWIKPPVRRYEGGFDAVFIDQRQGLMRFVQVVTMSSVSQTSVHLEFVAKFLGELLESKPSLEVAVVVDAKVALERGFRVSQVTGGDLLTAFPGWKRGGKADMKIKVLGIENVSQSWRTRSSKTVACWT